MFAISIFPSGISGSLVSDLISGITSWVANGAGWLLAEFGGVLGSTTSVQLSSNWFGARLSLMAEITAAVMLPMLFCAVIQAVYRQSIGALVKLICVNLPAALLLTGVAVELVRIALFLTDSMCAQFLKATGQSAINILVPLAGTLTLTPDPVAGFVEFVGALLIAIAVFCLWLEMTVRASAIMVAVLFLPLALGALVWPAISHWARRLVDTLVALILSKFLIVVIISLGMGAIGGIVGLHGSVAVRIGDLFEGMAILFLATFSPFVLLRLIPAFEAGAVGQLESARRQLTPRIPQALKGQAGRQAAATALKAMDDRLGEMEDKVKSVEEAMASAVAMQQAGGAGSTARQTSDRADDQGEGSVANLDGNSGTWESVPDDDVKDESSRLSSLNPVSSDSDSSEQEKSSDDEE
jgi:hypothetical protein